MESEAWWPASWQDERDSWPPEVTAWYKRAKELQASGTVCGWGIACPDCQRPLPMYGGAAENYMTKQPNCACGRVILGLIGARRLLESHGLIELLPYLGHADGGRGD